MRSGFGALAVALVLGSATAAISAVFIAELLDASEQTVLSLAPKSVTTPIAMGIAERIGGLPSPRYVPTETLVTLATPSHS